MDKNYDIEEVIKLRDELRLKWKEIEEIIGVSYETLRKSYKRYKEEITSHQDNPNSYTFQKIRGLKRKLYFIEQKGGKCECCGYDKNIAALDFHHINPDEKEFLVDARHLSNTSMEKLQIEVDKCKLLCANCHREIHNPSLEKENVPHLLDEYDEELVRPEKISNTKTSVCPVCGKEFPKVCGKIFCSKECNYKSKGYPEINEIMEQYLILNNWEKVASHFGISRKTIQRIRKKNGLL